MPARRRLSDDEIAARLTSVPGWQREGDWLRRTYKFETFPAAIAFVNRVAEFAEALDHHPDITIEYTKVTLRVSTHDAGGLTANDFELATRIDA
jgi:4a-hydroxytetrahydrobiopterin dehydratase